MVEYIAKAFAAWFIGFFPYFEIYVAVPVAIAMGLDYFSAVTWSVFGNYTPVILIHFFYEQIIKSERINRWFGKLTSEKFKQKVDKYGSWFVLIITPWIGIWVMVVTMKVFKMDDKKLILYSFISITAYAVVIAVLIATIGIDIFID